LCARRWRRLVRNHASLLLQLELRIDDIILQLHYELGKEVPGLAIDTPNQVAREWLGHSGICSISPHNFLEATG
jgi:hypothetical protein